MSCVMTGGSWYRADGIDRGRRFLKTTMEQNNATCKMLQLQGLHQLQNFCSISALF